MKEEDRIGSTIPLYDEVKRTIYINFNEMSYAYAELLTTHNKSSYKLALWDFKKRFAKFFVQVNHENKLKKITDNKQKYLLTAFSKLDKIELNHAKKIMDYSRELIEELGITKIEGKVKDTWGF